MDANLLSAMESSVVDHGSYKSRPALNNIVVYGRVRAIIKRPAMLPDTIIDGRGYYCIIDAYAMKCLGDDYFSESNKYDINNIYFTKGSMLAYIDSPKWVGKDVRLGGKYANSGVSIRRQEMKGSSNTEGIAAFVFNSAQGSGRKKCYELACNNISELYVGCKDSKGTVLEEFLVLLTHSGAEIPYSKTLDSIVPYSGVNVYEELSDSDILEEEEPQSIVSGVKTIPDYLKPDGTVDISKIRMNLTYHLEGLPKSKFYDDLRVEALDCERKRADAISRDLYKAKNEVSLDDVYGIARDLRTAFIKKVVSRGNRPLPRSNVKVSEFVKTFVSAADNVAFVYEDTNLNEKQKEAIRHGLDVLDQRVMLEPDILYGNSGTDADEIPMLGNDIAFSINVIAACTGISYDSFVSNYKYIHRKYGDDIGDWYSILVSNPYMVGMISHGLNIVDCDVIYYGITVPMLGESSMAAESRKKMLFLTTLEAACEGSISGSSIKAGTYVTLGSLKVLGSAAYPQRNVKNLESNDFVLPMKNVDVLELLVDKSIAIDHNARSALLGKGGKWYSKAILDSLVEDGVVSLLNDAYVGLQKTVVQEFIIYDRLYMLAQSDTGITDEQIEEVASAFEEAKGFKLEKLQRDALNLCKKRAAVLSGCAGSGKTTTSDAMAELFRRFDKRKLIYCAPTGKAARRLAEVQGTVVKTIHSQFKVMLGSTPLMPASYYIGADNGADSEGYIYFMDEMAMCSTELLYHAVKNLTAKDSIYFYGDIKQLPPIGLGCPFALLMKLLPCVELGVSKRAAEGSLINYNVSMINFMSKSGEVQPLRYDKESFIGIKCSNDKIENTVTRSFLRFMELGYQEDAIQVITGYQTDSRLSSTRRLNPPLQENLRKSDTLLFKRAGRSLNDEGKKYYKNERVIYVNRNDYNVWRYVYVGHQGGKDIMMKMPVTGIVNGEMGKLVGVIPTEFIRFIDSEYKDFVEGGSLGCNLTEEEYKDLVTACEERKDSLRDDSVFKGDGTFFVIVQVYDSSIRRDVLVLLRARTARGYHGEELCLTGSDLDNLDLAYALTCHKMQGSQSEVVIIALEEGSNPSFINRNMLNTMITRSQKVVCLIGDIDGANSVLTAGRQVASITKSKDLLSLLVGDVWL